MSEVAERRKGMSEESIANIAETIDSTDLVADNTLYTEYSFEDYYIDFFLAGHGKKESYVLAGEAYGCELPKYLAQAAYTLHKRLDSSGALQKALQRNVQSDQIASRLKLLSLMETAQSEQVQFASAKHVSGTLYTGDTASSGIQVTVSRDSVQIKHNNDTLTVENNKDIKEID